MSETRYNTVTGRMGVGIGFMLLTTGMLYIFEAYIHDSEFMLLLALGMFIVGAIVNFLGIRELDKIDRFLETIDHD